MKDHWKRLTALLLALMLLCGLMGCGEASSSGKDEQGEDPAPAEQTEEASPAETAGEEDAAREQTDSAPEDTAQDPLTEPAEAPDGETEEQNAEEPKVNLILYATSPFNQVFSPFFSTFPAEEEAVGQVVTRLLTYDRMGAAVQNGIEGETRNFNGTDYTYTGMGSVEIVQNEDGSADYKLTMRDDIVFSDGVPATIDDVIFGLYVQADPLYDGPSVVYTLPIEGMEAYHGGMEQRGAVIFADGRENGYKENDRYTAEQYDTFWTYYNEQAGTDFVREIMDYLVREGFNSASDSVAACAANWGFTLDEEATEQDFWNAIIAEYDSVEEAERDQSAGSTLEMLTIAALGDEFRAGVVTGETADSITGVQRTGDYTATIHMTRYEADAVYQMNLLVVPMHYYGDETLYDYENNSFGFVKGDLSGVKAKNDAPLGAGPYTFAGYAYGVVTLKANPFYYRGKPTTEILLMQETEDSSYVSGIVNGTYDVACPACDENTIREVKEANGGELVGDVITTVMVDYSGYGYLGINADLVNVGGDPDSDESKALRKGFMTLFSAYREDSVRNYYGDRAAVIQYPISETSWAAPKPEDEGYRSAYSLDVDGQPIYSEDMSREARFAAAREAAVGYFRAAGYNYDSESGKFTDLTKIFEIMIPGGGTQNHAAYEMCSQVSEVLEEMGITLHLWDVTERVWRNNLDTNNAMMWVGAWKTTFDPDMTKIYHSSNAHGQGTRYNHFAIEDPTLDALIEAGGASADTEERRSIYKQAMEIVMDWGCELPLYQRKDCVLFSTERVDISTIPQDITTFWGWDAEIERLAMR